MKQSDIQLLFDYNYWANARVLQAAAHLTPDQFIAPHGLSHGGVRGALGHVLAAEIVWRLRCQSGISPAALPTDSDFPTLDALRARWAEEETAMRAFLSTLSDDQLAQSVEYKTTKGAPYSNTLWQLLAHVVNHGTQFRAEAAVALTAEGHSPGDLDLLLFMRERTAKP
ncbi:MAG: DinB family protein [Chloroflexi bacterium]|nr:DinB family protein [Chloroflexota bacterium]